MAGGDVRLFPALHLRKDLHVCLWRCVSKAAVLRAAEILWHPGLVEVGLAPALPCPAGIAAQPQSSGLALHQCWERSQASSPFLACPLPSGGKIKSRADNEARELQPRYSPSAPDVFYYCLGWS